MKGAFRAALRDTVPVIAGYLFLGFGFGILMYSGGYGILPALLMSVFIYAGAMQYVTVGLLAEGASLLIAALTTLLVNARHLFYGISMIEPYRGTGRKKPYLIFALTDETFSLVSRESIPEGVNRHSYSLWVSLLDHCYWILGTLLGSLAGMILPLNLEGIEFALTALFVTIFIEQWLSGKRHLPAVIGVIVTALCLIIFGADIFLIPSMLIITASLTLMTRVGGEGDD